MKKIFNRYLITEKELKEFQHQKEYITELEKSIKDSDVEKERLKLEEKYKDILGNWYVTQDNYIIKIERVQYKPWGYAWQKFCFEASVPNMEDWMDIQFDDIKHLEKISQEEAKQRLIEY